MAPLVVRAGTALALVVAVLVGVGTGSHPGGAPDGRYLYTRHCAACHGAGGGRIPAVPLDSPEYIAGLGADGLEGVILVGTGLMPPLGQARGGPLTDTDARALAVYLLAAERFAAAGQRVYQRHCAACHGASGNRIPAAPLGSASFITLRRDRDLLEAVRRGSAAMPAFGHEQSGPLAEPDLQAVVSYLRALAAGSSQAPRAPTRPTRAADGIGDGSHSAGWLTTHPTFLRENSERLCAACHQPAFCATCHGGSGSGR